MFILEDVFKSMIIIIEFIKFIVSDHPIIYGMWQYAMNQPESFVLIISAIAIMLALPIGITIVLVLESGLIAK
jgi:hypothetical protein